MSVELTLSNKMRQLLIEHGEDSLPQGFRRSIEKYDAAVSGFFAKPQTTNVHVLTNTYAAARRLYDQAIEEPR